MGPNVGTDLGHEVKSQFLLMPWKNESAENGVVTRGNSPAAAVCCCCCGSLLWVADFIKSSNPVAAMSNVNTRNSQ